tara:strand:+ start:28 stop:330 length:303 start_codon:yes stop_codon:yes gene_type:complete
MKKLTILLFIVILTAKSTNLLKQANAALKAGMYEEALEHLIIAKEKMPLNAEVYKLKALLHEALNEKNKALNSWNKCIQHTNDKDLLDEAKIHINNLILE